MLTAKLTVSFRIKEQGSPDDWGTKEDAEA
jgi:hypothetical protein